MLSKKLLVAVSVVTIVWVALSATFFFVQLFQRKTENEILVVSINGMLTDSTVSLVQNAVNIATYRGSRLIVLVLDTPGGYVSSVERIMTTIDESEVPVVVFVEHRAVSGGTYTLMSSHIAVMKSSSQIGSCQPVTETGEPVTDSKYINYLNELMRNHAWLHTRNETAAQLFIKENLNLNGEQAFRYKVADLIADDLEDLLGKLDKYVLVRYREGESKRFVFTEKEDASQYEAIRMWNFENISQAVVRRYSGTFEYLNPPSTIFDFPIVLIFPFVLLFPYIYPILVVPILSLTISFSLETFIAVFSAIMGTIGIAYIILLLAEKQSEKQESKKP